VNLDVTVDAQGNVSVFGQAPVDMENVIVATVGLPASHLYKGQDNSLIRFQGPALAPETITAELHSTFAPNKTALKGALASIILGTFDCTDALPFKEAKYAGAYNSRTSFGHVALGAYANDLFGHIAATAAIDNDTLFMTTMNGTGAGQANIAGLLGEAIYALEADKCTAIAKQVIGQDASRAMGEDNDAYTPDLWQALEFKENDIVYMSVNLLAPIVSLSNNAQQTTPSSGVTHLYPIKITLSAPVVV
jgi:hypothetical protein